MPVSPSRANHPRVQTVDRWVVCAAMMVLLTAVPSRLPAQSRLLEIEVEPSSHVSRTGGPIALALRFNRRSAGVLDGQLLIELSDSEDVLLGRYVLEDLYLPEGVTRQEFMLSGMNVHSMNNEVRLQFRLLDRSGRVREQIRPASLRMPGQDRRSLVIAVCRPEFAGPGDVGEIVDALRLESLLPDYGTQQNNVIVTRSVELVPEDAPADPLRLCTYDMVLLTGEGFSQLSEQQLRALLAWTRAGGGVCLLAERARFDMLRLDFVNALLEREADDPVFRLNSSGAPVYVAGDDVDGVLRSRCGLGRAVIAGIDESSGDPSARHWATTSAFLWRLREEHSRSVSSQGVWDVDATIESARQFLGNQNQTSYFQYQELELDESTVDRTLRMQATDMDPIPLNGGAGLLARLMPGDIRVVPLWMIGLVLFAYVAVIGPLDFFVLGKLGLRRLTWVSFPVATLAFTVCSILVSNFYLKVADERRTLVIRDLDADSMVTRENRLDLLFPSTSRTMETVVGRGLFCPLRHQDFSRTAYFYDPYGYQTWERGRAEPAQFTGRMPTQGTVVQRMGQWTPQLNRTLTIPLTEDPAEFAPLAAPDLTEWIRSGSDGAIVQHLRSSTSDLVGAYLYGPDEAACLHGPQTLFQDSYGAYGQWNQVYVNGRWETRQIDFLQELSMRRQPGFFAVVSQIAPTGAYRFEDMALLDPTDSRQRLLVVAVEEDDQLVIYRKLYVLND